MVTTITLKQLTLCPLFAGLKIDEIESLMATVPYKIVYLNKGDRYATAGDLFRFADIILDGVMQADMTANSGRVVRIDKQHAGSLIMPSFIFAKQRRLPVSIVAIEPTTIFRILPDELNRLIAADATVRMHFIEMLSNISVFLAGKVRILGLATVRERTAQFLLHRSQWQNSSTIHLPYTRQEMANRLGIQRNSLQRTLAEFVEQGMIQIKGKEIVLINKEKLMWQE